MSVEDFRALSSRLEEYFDKVSNGSIKLKGDLAELMVAQDYQDLTGQIIRKVIVLVQEVEDKLVGVIRDAKPVSNDSKASGKKVVAEGPQINSAENPEVMSGQDDVDDLLSSLGF